MSSTLSATRRPTAVTPAAGTSESRGLGLGIFLVLLAQLMLVLDATVDRKSVV